MSMRDVLAVLDHHEDRHASTCAAAVELAQAERSRLTLVQCCEPPNIHLWLCPYAVGSVYLPPDEDPEVTASRRLAQALAAVPAEIPVTTMLIAGDVRKQLCRLIQGGGFDAIVAPEKLLRRARRLGRDLRDLGLSVVPVCGDGARSDAAAESPRPARPSLHPASMGSAQPAAAHPG